MFTILNSCIFQFRCVKAGDDSHPLLLAFFDQDADDYDVDKSNVYVPTYNTQRWRYGFMCVYGLFFCVRMQTFLYFSSPDDFEGRMTKPKWTWSVGGIWFGLDNNHFYNCCWCFAAILQHTQAQPQLHHRRVKISKLLFPRSLIHITASLPLFQFKDDDGNSDSRS